MRKTQTQRAATTSPTSKLRTTRWKSRTMQQLASGQRPELDFGPTKDELAGFDNDGQLMSIKDHCAVPPPEPRKPIIEPPTDVEALRRDYDARFSGLHAYGPTGATRLEELVEAALAASERAVAAYKAEKRAAHRSSSQIVPRATTCAALLASSGRVHVACAVRSNTDAALSVSAERAVVLRAVADGDRKFVGLVVADANSEELPVPDGAARQVLAEYGDFPVYLVNRDLRARRVTTHELFPLRVKTGHANANAPLNKTLPATAGEALDDALTGHVAKAVRDTAAREVLTGKHGSPSPSPKRKSRRRSKSSDSDSSGSPKRKARRGRSASSDSSPERSRRRRSISSDSDASSRKGDSGSDIEATDKPADPRAWTVDDVAAFVFETTKQPAHAATFKRAKVNGALLMRIDAQDLEETLKIDKALDRRRLCTALDKLRSRTHSKNARRHDEGLKGSSKASQKALDGYIDALDRDRVRCVARLKVAFDAQAPSKEGQDENERALDSEQLHRAFKSLRRDLNAPHVREWFDDLEEDSSLKFLEFVDAYVSLFASEDPDLKLSHGAAKALGDRVKVLASGHVQLSQDKVEEKKPTKKAELADQLKKTKKRSSSASWS
jgi:cytidine deaminase